MEHFLKLNYKDLPSCHINKSILPVKAHYFFFFSAIGALLPQMPLFGKQMGISPHVMGIITAILPILWATARALFGYLVDYCHAQRKFRFMVLLILMTTSYCSMYFLPETRTSSEIFLPANELIKIEGHKRSVTIRTIADMCNNNTCKNLTHIVALQCTWDCQLIHERREAWVLYSMPIADYSNRTDVIFTFAEDYIPRCEYFNMDASTVNITKLHRSTKDAQNSPWNRSHEELKFLRDEEEIRLKRETASNKDFKAAFDKFMRESSHSITGAIANGYPSSISPGKDNYVGDLKDPRRKCNFKEECSVFSCSPLADLTMDNSINTSLYKTSAFWIFVLLLCVGTLSFNLVNCISDAACFDALGTHNSLGYGAQRAWGTMGYALTALLSGYAIDLMSNGSFKKTFTPIFILAAVFIGLDLGCCTLLKLSGITRYQNSEMSFLWLFTSVPLLGFLGFAVIVGALDSFIIYYMFWFIEDLAWKTGDMDSIKILEGVSILMGCLSVEIVYYLVSPGLLKHLGYCHTLTISLICYSFRLLLISSMTSPYELIIIEFILQGATFGTGYSTIAGYAAAVAPSGKSAEFQNIVAFVDDGLGYTLGSLFGGIFYTIFGARKAFRIFSLLAFTAATTHFFVSKKWLNPTPEVESEWRREELMDMQAYVAASVRDVEQTATSERIETDPSEQTPILNSSQSDAALRRNSATLEALRN